METLTFEKNSTPTEIMENLWNRLFDPSQYASMEDYLTWLSHSLWKFNAIAIQIPDGNIDGKCASVVEQLIKVGYIKLEEYLWMIKMKLQIL